jgi:hypothetical protein
MLVALLSAVVLSPALIRGHLKKKKFACANGWWALQARHLYLCEVRRLSLCKPGMKTLYKCLNSRRLWAGAVYLSPRFNYPGAGDATRTPPQAMNLLQGVSLHMRLRKPQRARLAISTLVSKTDQPMTGI